MQGGQAQRVQIAIAVALKPAFLLLDEPTSALDVESARRVERLLKGCGAGLLWVSHDVQQPGRVGGKVLNLPAGTESAVLTPPPSPAVTAPPSLPRPQHRFQSSPDASGIVISEEESDKK